MENTDNGILANANQPLRSTLLSNLTKCLERQNALSTLYLRRPNANRTLHPVSLLFERSFTNRFIGISPNVTTSLFLQQAVFERLLAPPQLPSFGFNLGEAAKKHPSSLTKNVENGNYFDHAKFRNPAPAEALRNTGDIYTTSSTFAMKLYHMLKDERFSDCITWMPHGRSWKVLNQNELEEVLSLYFKHSNMPSFMRQVNGWGFCRVPEHHGADNEYYHEMFLRGFPDLCEEMKRKRDKKGGRHSFKSKDHLNFYDKKKFAPVPRSA
mmetsp:Transcript_12610/g.18538  ORF Transcript_12610/g.18538 Transcript_12610/m.18538 type:complete len:268 (+) Transcript_12610:236-1039(+)|eukprot:CAMPEP_0194237834 /NCGR_PEP_ID=MMETSP0158-20130606/4724_1 /TAXON_ID=33649 /ORGANISM="Thalassionema nitzschioides, Strain L26-B" /LENGTH=267 /DNA_ID=CAMNT_0038971947 /DNA_START=191 /DNA_END=994 /DNA_ORIENTATION=+